MKQQTVLVGCFMLLLFDSISGQNHHDNNWIFTGLNGDAIVNFSRGFPVVDTAAVPLEFAGASAVISNESGELQFYTNGCKIYGGVPEVMVACGTALVFTGLLSASTITCNTLPK